MVAGHVIAAGSRVVVAGQTGRLSPRVVRVSTLHAAPNATRITTKCSTTRSEHGTMMHFVEVLKLKFSV